MRIGTLVKIAPSSSLHVDLGRDARGTFTVVGIQEYSFDIKSINTEPIITILGMHFRELIDLHTKAT